MSEAVRISLSASAGVAVNIGGSSITIDAFHDDRVEGYSAVDETLFDELMKKPDFAKPSVIAYTHLHEDHFSERMTKAVLIGCPDSALILPERLELGLSETAKPLAEIDLDRHYLNESYDRHYLNKSYEEYDIGGFRIKCIRLTHDGEQYADVCNYAYIVEKNGIRLLHPGDCTVADTMLAEAIAEHGPIDIALLNFPWLALGKGRIFIREHMPQAQLYAIHLPFKEDDLMGYNAMLERQLKRFNLEEVVMLNQRGMVCELFSF